VQITLWPAGLHAAASPDRLQPSGPPRPAGVPARSDARAGPAGVPARSDTRAGSAGGGVADEHVAAVREALSDVIDPDLGVNVVDLGFVRAVRVEDRTAVITMTLTSAACPLTKIMEDQIGIELASLGDIEGFLVDWQWVLAWRPADITDSGREQLRAIGFTF
jgi:metal-sulfur cluster biosynthetic enzyme